MVPPTGRSVISTLGQVRRLVRFINFRRARRGRIDEERVAEIDRDLECALRVLREIERTHPGWITHQSETADRQEREARMGQRLYQPID